MATMRRGMLCISVVAGCYQPSPKAGAPCDPGECPSGQTCVGGFCEPLGSTTDGGPGGGMQLVPSNGISVTLLDGATAQVTYDKLDIDTDSGEMRSAQNLVRPAGEGLMNGINFVRLDGMGVFS